MIESLNKAVSEQDSSWATSWLCDFVYVQLAKPVHLRFLIYKMRIIVWPIWLSWYQVYIFRGGHTQHCSGLTPEWSVLRDHSSWQWSREHMRWQGSNQYQQTPYPLYFTPTPKYLIYARCCKNDMNIVSTQLILLANLDNFINQGNESTAPRLERTQ